MCREKRGLGFADERLHVWGSSGGKNEEEKAKIERGERERERRAAKSEGKKENKEEKHRGRQGE